MIFSSLWSRCGDIARLLTKGGQLCCERRAMNTCTEIVPTQRTMERLLDIGEADVLICGHTHIPYHRILPSGRHIVNAGSVGKPKDGNPEACYVVLEAKDHSLSVTLRRVPYDIERAARAIEATEMPNEYAEMLRTGTG